MELAVFDAALTRSSGRSGAEATALRPCPCLAVQPDVGGVHGARARVYARRELAHDVHERQSLALLQLRHSLERRGELIIQQPLCRQPPSHPAAPAQQPVGCLVLRPSKLLAWSSAAATVSECKDTAAAAAAEERHAAFTRIEAATVRFGGRLAALTALRPARFPLRLTRPVGKGRSGGYAEMREQFPTGGSVALT
jgi:hypothetical protein